MGRMQMGRHINLFLTTHGFPGERHFGEQFIRAFLRLPDATCGVLRAYWREVGGPYRPVVELVTLVEMAARFPEDKPRQTLAVVFDAGHQLWFRADIVSMAPDAVVQDLVGHELQHVVQHMLGLTFPDDAASEWDADARAEACGFSPFSVNRWRAGATRFSGPRTAAEIARHRGPGGRYSRVMRALLRGMH